MTEDAKRVVAGLREDLEWARANEWETPITLGDNLEEAADLIEALSAELERVTKERDAAKRDMILGRICKTCRHYGNSETSKCYGCLSWHSNWQWRGVKEE